VEVKESRFEELAEQITLMPGCEKEMNAESIIINTKGFGIKRPEKKETYGSRRECGRQDARTRDVL